MFMKQATTDRLLGMLVTLATGAAILYLQVSDDCLSRVGAPCGKVCVSRLQGMHELTRLSTLPTLPTQHRIKVFVNRRKTSGKEERPETKKVRPATAKPTHASGTPIPLPCCCVE